VTISDGDVDFFRYGGLINLGTQTEDGVTILSLLNLDTLFSRYEASLVSADENGDGRINIGETFTISDPGGLLSAPITEQLTLVGTGYYGTLLTGSVVLVGEDTDGNYWIVFPDGDAPVLSGLVASTLSIRTVGYDPTTGEPLCLCRGTMIATTVGERPVEAIGPGTMVLTRDAGPQPVRWTGSRSLGPVDLLLKPHLRPIRIRLGALGNGLPRRDLLLSPQHRVLVCSRIARRMFGASEVLVAAKHLLALPGFEVDRDMGEVVYHHILLDEHQLIYSEGAATESLYTGAYGLSLLSDDCLRELLELFPQLHETAERPHSARLLVPGRGGRKLAERHMRNHRPVLEPAAG